MALTLLIMTGCTPFVRYHDLTKEFIEQPNSTWVFSDEDLIVRFQSEKGPKFSWYFKNKSLLNLRIDQQYAAVYLENDPIAYTLWGEPKSEQQQFPILELVPGDFIEVGYPVLPSSPLFPFNRKQAVLVDLVITWNGKPTSYRLIIPARESKEV